ncbi:MAG: CPBP family intramembrane metalloprotease [Candidatus Eisenbacteria bacterium]|nr:CPBP family intramembrane metalloprotease [Candidatus Eisenbacteria bacterium]
MTTPDDRRDEQKDQDDRRDASEAQTGPGYSSEARTGPVGASGPQAGPRDASEAQTGRRDVADEPGSIPPASAPVGPGLHPYLKVLLYIVGYFVVGIAVSLVVAIVGGIFVAAGFVELPELDQSLQQMETMNVEELIGIMEPYLLPIVIATGLFTVFYTWAFIHIVDKKRLRSLGLHLRPGWSLDFSKGVGLAVLVLGVIFAFSIMIGSIRVEGLARPAPEGTSVSAYLIGALVAFFLVGLYEELMFRGYVLQRLNERAGKWASILVSSILFAVLHGANPGADVFGIFNTTIIAVILAVLYFRTRSLWMPVGFHFAWNFFLGYVYSLPVSGLPVYGVLNVVEIEPDSRLTGGTYGPEAGLATTIALAAWGAWLIWRRTGRRR